MRFEERAAAESGACAHVGDYRPEAVIGFRRAHKPKASCAKLRKLVHIAFGVIKSWKSFNPALNGA